MAKSNLATRLTKELRRSPKKTAVLALMFVVALWFWAPLAWKWVAPQSGEAAAAGAASDVLAAAPSPSPAGVATTAAPSAPTSASALNWKELADVLENDPLLASARMHEKLADPFAVPLAEKPAASDNETVNDELQAAASETKLSPAQLGLVLRSTITGGRHAVATINGRSCRVGDVLAVPAGGRDFEFMVTSIDAGGVTLTAGEESYVLAVERPDSTMQLSQAGAPGSASPALGGQRVVIGARLGE